MSIVNDPIGDLLTRIRNAQAVSHLECSAPWSKMKEQLLNLLKREGWVADVVIEGKDPKKSIRVTFIPEKGKLTLTRVSKPGRRVYSPANELRPVLRGFGFSVLTTSVGLLTDAEARKKKIGGEILCTIS